MRGFNRRDFLGLAGAMGAGLATRRATAIGRKRRDQLKGSIEDVQHVVILMQENRGFDHYFGRLRGVRGFSDPHPALLASGLPVWHQSDGRRVVLPFHAGAADAGGSYIVDLPHDWRTTHLMFNNGRYDQWLPNKTPAAMAWLDRADIPFHYALADAYTICDAYFSSVLGPTHPNRYYLWTGSAGNDGQGGGPDLDNGPGPFSWTTYPERLSKAGVSWKIYQDAGLGLDAAGHWGESEDPFIGNYGDNSLLNFASFRAAAPGSDLHERARLGTQQRKGQDYFELLALDVAAGQLPQVSWIIAPEAFSEHGNWPANYGAWYVGRVIDTLASNPEVWSRTALILTYDENDGQFDHLVPPHPQSEAIPGSSTVSTQGEHYSGEKDVAGPFGLGVRVPTLVISPWSTGGWLCSEVFDHTSVIRFLEARFGVQEPNISAWRRSICGDLTSAFNFSHFDPVVPRLPDTAGFAPRDRKRHPDYLPLPPDKPTLPRQEPGSRPSRALDHQLQIEERSADGALRLGISNRGKLGVHAQIRSNNPAWSPRSYTIGAGGTLQAALPLGDRYDYRLHGPNGFYRHFAGQGGRPEPQIEVEINAKDQRLRLKIANTGRLALTLRVRDAYRASLETLALPRGDSRTVDVPTADSGGWYDLRLSAATDDDPWLRQYAGRIETGLDTVSDPQLGR